MILAVTNLDLSLLYTGLLQTDDGVKLNSKEGL
jgi:hypothetical protein